MCEEPGEGLPELGVRLPSGEDCVDRKMLGNRRRRDNRVGELAERAALHPSALREPLAQRPSVDAGRRRRGLREVPAPHHLDDALVNLGVELRLAACGVLLVDRQPGVTSRFLLGSGSRLGHRSEPSTQRRRRAGTPRAPRSRFVSTWWRESDLNGRPPGYEPSALPGCAIPLKAARSRRRQARQTGWPHLVVRRCGLSTSSSQGITAPPLLIAPLHRLAPVSGLDDVTAVVGRGRRLFGACACVPSGTPKIGRAARDYP